MDYCDPLTRTEARACVTVGGVKRDGLVQGSLDFMCCAKLGRRPAQCALTGRGRGVVGERGENRENSPCFPSFPSGLSQKVAQLETPQ